MISSFHTIIDRSPPMARKVFSLKPAFDCVTLRLQAFRAGHAAAHLDRSRLFTVALFFPAAGFAGEPALQNRTPQTR
ncbi:hypothetical protein [Hansschlegelia plantiphila]|uniref:hypothetical protein n=1 Tax=Hansschlegelia plantiphila TaxID=374655 RepID=UPI0022F28A52|nr:hypothetical protein [Hansschlegelia plantiphila]